MDNVMLIGLVLRWLHVLAAVALMGGAVFQRFVLLPAAAELPDEAHDRLRAAVRGRWSRIVMMSAGLLVASGLINFVLLVVSYQLDRSVLPGRLYHMVFGIKFLLALIVLYIASLLVGRSALAERARQNARTWLTLNLLLATLVVCLGGFLRQAPRSLKGEGTSGQSSQAVVRPEVSLSPARDATRS